MVSLMKMKMLNENENVNDGVYVTLSERYRKLTNKHIKTQMKKEKLANWTLPKGKQTIIFYGSSKLNFNLTRTVTRTVEPRDYFHYN